MVDFDQKPGDSPAKTRSIHVSMSALTIAGSLFAAITFTSGYVTGIMTMRDTIASIRTDLTTAMTRESAREETMNVRMTRIENQNERILDSLNEFKLRSGTKQ